MSGEVSRCRACQAPIIWTVTAKTGKKMPVDEEPKPYGDFFLEERGRDLVAHHVNSQHGLAVTIKTDRFVSHFGTCPQAAEFRKAKATT
jgi:hypothetical protein